MSKFSYIKKMIEQNKKSIINRTASGLVALGLLSGALVGCNDITKPTETEYTNQITDNVGTGTGNFTEITDSTSNSTNPSNQPSKPKYEPIKHSETWHNAQRKWGDVWTYGISNNLGISEYTQLGFETKGVPFRFLAENGAVYYNENGKPRAYGTDDDFDNVNTLRSAAFIDESTKENDFYLLVQYSTKGVDKGYSNTWDANVVTWMLKYTLSDECYRDVLLLNNDRRIKLLIQQIDEDYSPEIISKSVLTWSALSKYGLSFFTDIEGLDNNQASLEKFERNVCYVENIDYETGDITINYTLKNNLNDIYSYTYNIKEAPDREDILQHITEEQFNNLELEKIMKTIDTSFGKCLEDCNVGWYGRLSPGAEQKATAEVKYNYASIFVDDEGVEKSVVRYENGEIPFEQVNDLTRQYAKENGLMK